MQPPRTSPNAAVQLYPRRKAGTTGSPIPKGRSPMLLSYQGVASLFGRPQTEAAERLGISLTSLKQVCRKLGVPRWPYARPSKAASAKRRMQAAVDIEAAQTKAEESDSSDASHSSAETTCASPDRCCSPEQEGTRKFSRPLAALPGPQIVFADRGFSDERHGGQAMCTHQRHFDDVVFSPSEASNACGIVSAPDRAQQDAFQDPLGGAMSCEPESMENEQDHELGGTDLSWLVSDTDFERAHCAPSGRVDDDDAEWWAQVRRTMTHNAWTLECLPEVHKLAVDARVLA